MSVHQPNSRGVVTDPEYHAVKSFMLKFGILTCDGPMHLKTSMLDDRIVLMREELEEFIEGALEQDMAKMADALVDLVYVAKGTAVQLGLPWCELMNDVHDANMRKQRGQTKRAQKVDVCKPAGWIGPRTMELLVDAGYDRRDWIWPNGEVNPTKLVGYPEDDHDL
jgi:hypothetical protein